MRELAFLIVDLPSVYNAILSRPFFMSFRAVTSIHHLKMKFSTPYDVGEVLGDQVMGRTCYLSQVTLVVSDRIDRDLDLRDQATLQTAQSGEATEVVPLEPVEPAKCVHIGGFLTAANRNQLISFLQKNSDMFTWVFANMPGILAEVILQKLGLDSGHKPVKQRRRNHSVKKLVVISVKVKRLLDTGFIKEV
ncbi:hypothetical protein Nepgr_007037 [Nepenthes gracilis]|uniref:Uncharacterized protein n=1 Tax=Nepenthes gracilis TaxID=150966 RepID=A0AAD3S646_NEPGR|nr:hypothetical protein Nepgr_007037 [Nepenthes gracilis]